MSVDELRVSNRSNDRSRSMSLVTYGSVKINIEFAEPQALAERGDSCSTVDVSGTLAHEPGGSNVGDHR